ncbi:MAG TPA: PocR ligand-binding domain-containing protein [Bacteroidales bacterium]|nr:PocR ligand-binding domain-containing protein [Bacteroidales bacterium]HPS71196.1 PocR ligand-binding domain-containing protein [Bacteroidales bacterium]
MTTQLDRIFDFEKVNTLLEGFNKTTGFVTAILDLKGNVLSKSGWRDLCTEFHRINPKTAFRCTFSDTILASKMAEGENYHCYKCLNGLVDVAVPIIIRGVHVGNLFSGQFFFEEPDYDFFRKQAKEFGFDQEKYLKAVSEVPIKSEEQVKFAMNFLLQMTEIISDQGYQNLVLEEINSSFNESNNRFYTIFYANPIPISIMEYETKTYTNVNQSWCNFFGYQPEEVIGSNYEKLGIITTETRKLIDETLERDGRINTIEMEVYTKSGVKKNVFYNRVLIKIQDQDYIVYLMTDITERKEIERKMMNLNIELEEKVRQRTSDLEASNKELESFSYSVSHDLRAPLRHINGYVDLLNERFNEDLPEKAQHYLQVISNASKQMGTLIDELLLYSRTGRQVINKIDLNMDTLIREIVEKFYFELKDRKIEWEISKLPIIIADYTMMKQVWTNLIDNALKYSRNNEITKIKIGYSEAKDYYKFFIQDNGVGFDMKYAGKLFGVFQRLHSQTEFEGTGIGLANVQRIIHKHNGRVWADAELNKGATFYYTIPKKL